MTTDTMNFSADVSRLLDIVANALYTNHDVFLRELISNAADACDRLRYDAIQNPELTKDNPSFRIHVYKDTTTRTLVLVDNGIGMNKGELIDHLGTIAKSGTAALMEKMKAAPPQGDSLKLIGQFGVGFYASYMVATKVTVVSRKAGESETWTWVSDGRTGFDVREATQDEIKKLDGTRGTAVILNIKDEAAEFLLDEKIKLTSLHYSDHIDVPIFLGEPGTADKEKPLNKASALWTRPKADITVEQYNEFYRHISHGFDEPLMISHWHAEGKIEYTGLLFIPTLRPWDLFDPSRRSFVNLYVRRVFITDSLETLMFPWLRFVRGVIDSQDLPLNISRESLRYNPLLPKIRSGVAKKILSDLDRISHDDEHAFIAFWGQFGAVIKEGLYDAAEHREDIFKICRFYSTLNDGEKFISLDDYVSRMKEGQEAIYYITADSLAAAKGSPQLEVFRKKGIEVLLFTDRVDEWMLSHLYEFDGKPLTSVAKGGVDLGKLQDENEKKAAEETAEAFKPVLERLKAALKDRAKDVRTTTRLVDSPACIVVDEGDMSSHLARMLKQAGQGAPRSQPILEVNAEHPLVKRLETDERFDDLAQILFGQALLAEGGQLEDPAAYVQRINRLLVG